MPNISNYESAALGVARFSVKSLNKDLQETTSEYTLVLDFNALAKAQQHIGRDFCDVASWQNLNSSDLSTLAWCALDRFHPEVTIQEVRSWLSPAQRHQLWAVLIEMTFPGITQRIEKMLAEKEQQPGESQPNSPAS